MVSRTLRNTRDVRNDTLQYWLKSGFNVHVWIMRPNQD
jgi:hypothetical protein